MSATSKVTEVMGKRKCQSCKNASTPTHPSQKARNEKKGSASFAILLKSQLPHSKLSRVATSHPPHTNRISFIANKLIMETLTALTWMNPCAQKNNKNNW